MNPLLRGAMAGLLLLLLAACGGGGGEQPPAGGEGAGAEASAPAATEGTEAASPVAQATEGPAPTATLSPDQFTNPVLDRDFADPDILQVGDVYYAYSTNSAGQNIQAARSEDLVRWERLPDAFPALPPWAALNFGFVWAPEVTTSADGSSYLMYYTARFAEADRQCIGVATSDSPEGPFLTVGEEPLICQLEEGGSIDAGSFVDEDGSRYLLWKSDANCCGGDPNLYIQPISDDGLTLTGEPTILLTRDQGWEGRVIEAPTLWKHEGRYYLFYSANDYAGANYSVGYAVADSLLGPYEKAPGPWLESNLSGGAVGPGGQDIVLDAQGETWMVYHSWAPASYRHMWIDELVWEDGAPVLLGPERTPQIAPNVEVRQ